MVLQINQMRQIYSGCYVQYRDFIQGPRGLVQAPPKPCNYDNSRRRSVSPDTDNPIANRRRWHTGCLNTCSVVAIGSLSSEKQSPSSDLGIRVNTCHLRLNNGTISSNTTRASRSFCAESGRIVRSLVQGRKEELPNLALFS